MQRRRTLRACDPGEARRACARKAADELCAAAPVLTRVRGTLVNVCSESHDVKAVLVPRPRIQDRQKVRGVFKKVLNIEEKVLL